MFCWDYYIYTICKVHVVILTYMHLYTQARLLYYALLGCGSHCELRLLLISIFLLRNAFDQVFHGLTRSGHCFGLCWSNAMVISAQGYHGDQCVIQVVLTIKLCGTFIL